MHFTCSSIDHLISGLKIITNMQDKTCVNFAYIKKLKLAIILKSLTHDTKGTLSQSKNTML